MLAVSVGADQREAAQRRNLARPGLPFSPMRKRVLRIDAGASPGRAQRVGGIEEPGRVAAMRHKGKGGNGRHRQAAFRSGLNLASVSTAMAQRKPSNSRPTAVTICGFFLPAAASFL
jgi:hypothetical protein